MSIIEEKEHADELAICLRQVEHQAEVLHECNEESKRLYDHRERLRAGVTPLKLSEAMRLGAMWRPQGRFALITASGASCAWGAAYEAVGAITFNGHQVLCSPEGIAERIWPIHAIEVECPVTHAYRQLGVIIGDLNDLFRWTRERIADWVATIEAQQECELPQFSAEVRLPMIPERGLVVLFGVLARAK